MSKRHMSRERSRSSSRGRSHKRSTSSPSTDRYQRTQKHSTDGGCSGSLETRNNTRSSVRASSRSSTRSPQRGYSCTTRHKQDYYSQKQNKGDYGYRRSGSQTHRVSPSPPLIRDTSRREHNRQSAAFPSPSRVASRSPLKRKFSEKRERSVSPQQSTQRNGHRSRRDRLASCSPHYRHRSGRERLASRSPDYRERSESSRQSHVDKGHKSRRERLPSRSPDYREKSVASSQSPQHKGHRSGRERLASRSPDYREKSESPKQSHVDKGHRSRRERLASRSPDYSVKSESPRQSHVDKGHKLRRRRSRSPDYREKSESPEDKGHRSRKGRLACRSPDCREKSESPRPSPKDKGHRSRRGRLASRSPDNREKSESIRQSPTRKRNRSRRERSASHSPDHREFKSVSPRQSPQRKRNRFRSASRSPGHREKSVSPRQSRQRKRNRFRSASRSPGHREKSVSPRQSRQRKRNKFRSASRSPGQREKSVSPRQSRQRKRNRFRSASRSPGHREKSVSPRQSPQHKTNRFRGERSASRSADDREESVSSSQSTQRKKSVSPIQSPLRKRNSSRERSASCSHDHREKSVTPRRSPGQSPQKQRAASRLPAEQSGRKHSVDSVSQSKSQGAKQDTKLVEKRQSVSGKKCLETDEDDSQSVVSAALSPVNSKLSSPAKFRESKPKCSRVGSGSRSEKNRKAERDEDTRTGPILLKMLNEVTGDQDSDLDLPAAMQDDCIDYCPFQCGFQPSEMGEILRHIQEVHALNMGQQIPPKEELNAIREGFRQENGRLTAQKFNKLIKEQKLRKIAVPGNGYCFLSCLLITLWEIGIEKTRDNLAIEIMNELTNHITHYAPFLKNVDNQSFLDICANYLQSGEYNNENIDVLFGAVANAVGINLNVIQIVQKRHQLTQFNCTRYSSQDNVFLFFKWTGRKNKNLDAHYDCYVKEEYFQNHYKFINSQMVGNDCDSTKQQQRPSTVVSDFTQTGFTSNEESIGSMLDSLSDKYQLVRVLKEQYDDVFSDTGLYEIVTDEGDPPIVIVKEQDSSIFNTSVESNTSRYTTGSSRGSYYASTGKSNVKYNETHDPSQMSPKARVKYQNAMRGRKYRDKKAAVKLAASRPKKKTDSDDPVSVEKLARSRILGKESKAPDNRSTDNDLHEDPDKHAARSQCNLKQSKKNRQRNYRKRQRERLKANARKRALRRKQKTKHNSRIVQAPKPSQQNSKSLWNTPKKYISSIRQRLFDVSKKLPSSPKFKTAVVGRLVRKMLKSPSTNSSMSGILDSCHDTQAKPDLGNFEDQRILQSLVLQLKKFKSQKNFEKHQAAAKKLIQRYTIRGACKRLNMRYSQLYRLLQFSGKHARALPIQLKKRVIQFYSTTKISLQLPFRKYSKFFYLRTPLSVAYQEYAKEQLSLGYRVLKPTSVYRCIKKMFRVRKKIPFKDSQCDTCVNLSLLVDSLIANKVSGIKRRLTENILRSYCPLPKNRDVHVECPASRKLEFTDSETISDHERDCIFRHCKKCGAIPFQNQIVQENPDIDWNSTVTWSQWVTRSVPGKNCPSTDNYVTGENQNKAKKGMYQMTDKVRFRGTLSQLLTLFTCQLNKMSIHLFHFRWQAMQFEECKKQLQDGDVLMVMDFAQNYTHHRQDEIQGGFWSRNQTTLHPMVTYYPCTEEGCNHLVRDEIMVLSDDRTHDYQAVNAFVKRALAHLESKGIPVKRLIMWSDNCGVQYKSCSVFYVMSEMTSLLCQRNYFCAKHGKAEADGCIGRLSMHIDAVVRSGSHEFSNASELVAYCDLNLKLSKEEKGTCVHWQRHYFEVTQINRDASFKARTVEGTLDLHSVRNTGRVGFIEVRESSCFCEVCFLNQKGVCKSEHLVQRFAWARLKNLSKEEKEELGEEFKNVLWETTSNEYQRHKYEFVPQFGKRKNRCNLNDINSGEGKAKKGYVHKNRHVEVDEIEESYQSIQLHDLEQSSESDVEDNIPLSTLVQFMANHHAETPVGHRTRSKNVLICNREAEVFYTEDYEEMKGQPDSIETSTPIHGNPPGNLNIIKGRVPLSPIIGENPMLLEDFPDVNYLSNRDTFNFTLFQDILLQCKTFNDLKATVLDKLSDIPPLPDRYVCDEPMTSDIVDSYSHKYVPDDLPEEFAQHDIIKIPMQGSCYCCSLSRLVYGTTERDVEMRCRLTVDSVLNMDKYLSHEYLMRGAVHKHKKCTNIATYYCLYSKVTNFGKKSETKEGIKQIYMKEIMRTRKSSEYCGIWQFHSGANILNTPLYMAFPEQDTRHDFRTDFNRVFLPSKTSKHKMLGLLWIPSFEPGMLKSDGQRNTRTYDHIVPFIKSAKKATSTGKRAQKESGTKAKSSAKLKSTKKTKNVSKGSKSTLSNRKGEKQESPPECQILDEVGDSDATAEKEEINVAEEVIHNGKLQEPEKVKKATELVRMEQEFSKGEMKVKSNYPKMTKKQQNTRNSNRIANMQDNSTDDEPIAQEIESESFDETRKLHERDYKVTIRQGDRDQEEPPRNTNNSKTRRKLQERDSEVTLRQGDQEPPATSDKGAENSVKVVSENKQKKEAHRDEGGCNGSQNTKNDKTPNSNRIESMHDAEEKRKLHERDSEVTLRQGDRDQEEELQGGSNRSQDTKNYKGKEVESDLFEESPNSRQGETLDAKEKPKLHERDSEVTLRQADRNQEEPQATSDSFLQQDGKGEATDKGNENAGKVVSENMPQKEAHFDDGGSYGSRITMKENTSYSLPLVKACSVSVSKLDASQFIIKPSEHPVVNDVLVEGSSDEDDDQPLSQLRATLHIDKILNRLGSCSDNSKCSASSPSTPAPEKEEEEIKSGSMHSFSVAEMITCDENKNKASSQTESDMQLAEMANETTAFLQGDGSKNENESTVILEKEPEKHEEIVMNKSLAKKETTIFLQGDSSNRSETTEPSETKAKKEIVMNQSPSQTESTVFVQNPQKNDTTAFPEGDGSINENTESLDTRAKKDEEIVSDSKFNETQNVLETEAKKAEEIVMKQSPSQTKSTVYVQSQTTAFTEGDGSTNEDTESLDTQAKKDEEIVSDSKNETQNVLETEAKQAEEIVMNQSPSQTKSPCFINENTESLETQAKKDEEIVSVSKFNETRNELETENKKAEEIVMNQSLHDSEISVFNKTKDPLETEPEKDEEVEINQSESKTQSTVIIESRHLSETQPDKEKDSLEIGPADSTQNGSTASRQTKEEEVKQVSDSEVEPSLSVPPGYIMSMEEYRLRNGEELQHDLINKTVDYIPEALDVQSKGDLKSDTTATDTQSAEESDEEYELVIHRKKMKKARRSIQNWTGRSKTKRITSSGAIYGFPLLKVIPEALKTKCINQTWDGIEIRSGLPEGRGLFSTKSFTKGEIVCNYGGTNVPVKIAEKDLLPFDDRCDYLVELFERSSLRWQNFYLDCTQLKTYGQILNHSSLHPNVIPDVYAAGPQRLDILFRTLREIECNEQLVWNYGSKYGGVKPCVDKCKLCL